MYFQTLDYNKNMKITGTFFALISLQIIMIETSVKTQHFVQTKLHLMW